MQNELNLDVRQWVIQLARQTNASARVALVYHSEGITVVMSVIVFDHLFQTEHTFSQAGVMACKCTDAAVIVLADMMLKLLQEINECRAVLNQCGA